MAKKDNQQSRNSWINTHEPTEVTSLAHFKDGFEDVLGERRVTSDLKYILKSTDDVPTYKYRVPRSPEKVKDDVYKSDRVKYAAEAVAREKGKNIKEVMNEVKSILDELGHKFTMKGVRFFAFFMVKIFKALFRRVYVNKEGLDMLKTLTKEYPVILMPTHRSYMDFLLVSYIMFDYGLPLPIIAAAMDFSGMKFIGTLLNMCGAFYIRRSFGTDKLYWAVFTEYIQTQLRNGDAPIEFFVEGTRSRTGKSYQPRIGMLSAALESYFKAEVPDVMIVPISISYERILEESLYAYELLGIPKPKESTSALFKARSILEEDFGSVHIYISSPISIRHISVGHIERELHSLEPRYINNLTDKESEVTTTLAYKIAQEHQKHLVISPWSIITAVLMQSGEGITLMQLVKEADWLRRQAVNFGGFVDWPGNASSEDVVKHNLQLHTNVVSLNEDGLVQLKVVKASHVKSELKNELMVNAATDLLLASYRNQLLHIFVRPGMVSLCINGCTSEQISLPQLYEKYQFLQMLLSQEFVFVPGKTHKDFDHAVQNLKHCYGLVLEGDLINIRKSLNKHSTFFSQMLEPFLIGYWTLCQHLLCLPVDVHGRPLPKKAKPLARDAQQLAIKLLQDRVISHYEVLSLELLLSGLTALHKMKAIHRDKREEEPWLSPDVVAVTNIARRIGDYVEIPHIELKLYTQNNLNRLVAKI